MATARSNSDALGFYLSDPARLGGARADLEFCPVEPVIEPGLPPIILERVSGSCGVGLGRIVAAGADSLQFAAPGEELGAAVTVSANTSALLESESPGKSVRVYRDSVYNGADLSGEIRFDLVIGVNNTIGLGNGAVAGGVKYGCVWMVNHSAAAVTGITVSGSGVMAVGLETPSDGLCQVISDDETAPSAVTFGATATVATLAAGESRLIWVRRTLTAPSVTALALAEIEVEFTAGGETYTETLPGQYRVADGALAQYELFLGEDGPPDFGAAPTQTGALPLVAALAAGHRWEWAVRARNAYDLSSQNTLTRVVTLNGDGEEAGAALTNPEIVSMTSAPGGEVDLRLRYNGLADVTPGDTFRVYVRTNGTNPDPETDSPIDTQMTVTGLVRPEIEAIVKLGPYTYGTPVAVIARVYSTTLEAESDSTTVSSMSVTTQAPVGMHQFAVSAGGMHGAGRTASTGTVYYDAPTNSVGIKTLSGEVVLFGSSAAFRAEHGSQTLCRTALDFVTSAQGASGSASPIEAISADEIYLNVSGVRQARIDFVAGIIEAAAFTLGADRIDLPVIGPVYTTPTATNIMVRNSVTGRWTPAIRVDNTGRLTIYMPVRQEAS